jgi:hypothetical protein
MFDQPPLLRRTASRLVPNSLDLGLGGTSAFAVCRARGCGLRTVQASGRRRNPQPFQRPQAAIPPHVILDLAHARPLHDLSFFFWGGGLWLYRSLRSSCHSYFHKL